MRPDDVAYAVDCTMSPLDEYMTTRRNNERHLPSLISYRETCRKRAEAAALELGEVDAAIDELETLLHLKAQPCGVAP